MGEREPATSKRSAALIVDGILESAVSEERLTRSKYTGVFPGLAIESVLYEAGIEESDLDGVCLATSINHDPEATQKILAERFEGITGPTPSSPTTAPPSTSTALAPGSTGTPWRTPPSPSSPLMLDGALQPRGDV